MHTNGDRLWDEVNDPNYSPTHVPTSTRSLQIEHYECFTIHICLGRCIFEVYI